MPQLIYLRVSASNENSYFLGIKTNTLYLHIYCMSFARKNRYICMYNYICVGFPFIVDETTEVKKRFFCFYLKRDRIDNNEIRTFRT